MEREYKCQNQDEPFIKEDLSVSRHRGVGVYFTCIARAYSRHVDSPY